METRIITLMKAFIGGAGAGFAFTFSAIGSVLIAGIYLSKHWGN
ncbi:hypothetical protein ACNSO8_01240 [Yersinia sp. LJYL362]